MPTIRTAVVNGRTKGEVYRKGGFWQWVRQGTTETYPTGSTLEDVRSHIARLCSVSARDVRLQERA